MLKDKLNTVKYKVRSFSKAVECTKNVINYGNKIVRDRKLITTVEGDIKVYLSDDYVATVCGDLTGPAAFAFPTEREIYINTAMAKMPRGYANAIMCHEIGHIVLEHRPGATYAADNAACKGPGFDIELEADAYAQDRGYDMLGALQWLMTHGYYGDTVKARLAALAKRKFGK